MTKNKSPVRVIRVNMDSLEYTRTGLRTRAALPVEVGRHNRVVLVRPTHRQALGQGANGFPNDSAFPLLATLSVFWSLADEGTPFTHHERKELPAGQTAFQVFAHTSASGDESHNKSLSDTRAKVGLALLRGDAALLCEVAEADGWATREHQAMLRSLACDPGPLDDKIGKRTESAVALFQARYNSGVYHHRHGAVPAMALKVDGQLNSDCEKGLFEAFVFAHGACAAAADVHPTHPANGCSEYNALDSTGSGGRNRRLALIAHPRIPVYHANAPCTVGDEGRCAVVDDRSMRCMYYREHVVEREDTPVVFADPRWMWLGEDRYLLSALTNIDGEADVEFEVYDAVDRVRGPVEVTNSWLEQPRSKVLKGVVLRGVAQVVWASGQSPPASDGRPEFDNFPVFRVRDPVTRAFTFAPWPEVQTLRILVSSVDRSASQARPVQYRLRCGDGSYDKVAALEEAEPVSSHHLAVVFEDVPLDVRLTLSVGANSRWAYDVIENVVAARLPGNCASGSQCKELPVPIPPPDPEEPQQLDEDEDNANPWLAGDESLFDEPVFF